MYWAIHGQKLCQVLTFITKTYGLHRQLFQGDLSHIADEHNTVKGIYYSDIHRCIYIMCAQVGAKIIIYYLQNKLHLYQFFLVLVSLVKG